MFDLKSHTHLLTIAGSRAYGMHRADSDVDVKGVAIPPRRYFTGYLHRFEQSDKPEQIAVFAPNLTEAEQTIVASTKLEGTVFNLVKFVALAADCNPNILDVLFCRDAEVRQMSVIGARLRENRDLFLSSKVKHTFSGYAAAQLKRVKSHRAWLLNPPKQAPTREEFGLPNHTLIPADHMAAANAAVQTEMGSWGINFSGVEESVVIDIQTRVSAYLTRVTAGVEDAEWTVAAHTIGLSDNLIHAMQQERAYENAQKQWASYRNWQRNRNPARAALEEKHGYDTKHGAHLVRLLRMGSEILETGKVNVWRGIGGTDDAEELSAIRAGAWSYDRLVGYAEDLDARLTRLYMEGALAVPKHPDRNAIDDLCTDLVETATGR